MASNSRQLQVEQTTRRDALWLAAAAATTIVLLPSPAEAVG